MYKSPLSTPLNNITSTVSNNLTPSVTRYKSPIMISNQSYKNEVTNNKNQMELDDDDEEETFPWPFHSYISIQQEYFRTWFDQFWIKRGRRMSHLLKFLEYSKIKVIACDFDLTMTNIHSGGSIHPLSSPCTSYKVLHSLAYQVNQFLSAASSLGVLITCVTFAEALNKNDDLTSSSIGDHCDEIGGESLVRYTLQTCKATFPLTSVYSYYPENYITYEKYSSIGLTSPMTDDKRLFIIYIFIYYLFIYQFSIFYL